MNIYLFHASYSLHQKNLKKFLLNKRSRLP